MEEQFRKIVALLQAGAAAAFAIISNWLISYLESQHFNVNVATFMVFAAAVFVIRMADTGFSHAVNNWPWLRRIIFGRHHIEGDWFDIVLVPSEKQVREYGLISISIEESRFMITGILFDKSFRRIGDFSTHFARYRDSRIEYAYKRKTELDKHEVGSGLGEYEFSPDRPYPMEFNGTFFDPALDRDIRVRGLRIIAPDDTKQLARARRRHDGRINNVQVEMVKKYAEQFYLQFPEYQSTALTVSPAGVA
jgi:hypothetical protein